LKRAFPSWEEVRLSKPAPIELAVKCGGLATIKVARIQIILNTLHQERGEASLEYLREMDDESVKKELSRFKGVGPKTISCVLMFCLKRPDFPVDAHVWKIALSLGWIPKSASRDTAYTHLNRRYARTAFPNHRRLCVQEHPRLTLCFTRRKSPGRVQVRPSRATGGAR
jgi:endonuclease-3